MLVRVAVRVGLGGPVPAPFCGVAVKLKEWPGRGWGGEKVNWGVVRL